MKAIIPLLALLWYGTVSGVAGEMTLEVPEGQPVLPNGMFPEQEWQDASRLELDGSTELLCKTSGDYVLVGLRFVDVQHTGVDLYLAGDGDNCRMLHVSSALGERFQDSTGWSDIDWCANAQWTANSIGTVTREGTTEFVAPDGFEFQIHRDMFDNSRWLMMVHLKRPKVVLPETALPDDRTNWLVLELPEYAELAK